MAAAYPSSYPRYYPEGLVGPPPPIHGCVAEGFESVKAVFAENFEQRCERGGALCVYFRGEKVIDLWAGERYLGVPWEEDTIVNIYSTTKGLAALGLALLHSRGLLDYDAKVGTYWPEFACNGKEDITVRELLAHRVGVCCVEANLTEQILADPIQLGTALATTKAEWLAGAKKNGYMGVTIGWYDDQLCRRIDPQGRDIVTFVKEEICTPVGCADEFFCGLPPADELDRGRIASLNAYGTFDMMLRSKFPSSFVNNFALNPSSYVARAFSNPPMVPRDYGEEWVRKLMIPGANGHASARAVAGIYNTILTAGRNGAAEAAASKPVDVGFTPATVDQLLESAEPLWDEVLRTKSCFSLGFCKPADDFFVFGSSDKAFGTPGCGGALGFADPDADLSFGYVTNRIGMYMAQDPRELALRAEVYRAIEKNFPGVPSRPQVPDPVMAKFIEHNNTLETHWMDPVLHRFGNTGTASIIVFGIVVVLARWFQRGA